MALPKIKIILYKSKLRADGTYPLVIRITKDRKRRYIFTKYFVTEAQWDPTGHGHVKDHPNSLRLNNILKKKLTEAEDIIIDMDREKKNLNAIQIKHKLNGETGGSVYTLSKDYLKSKKQLGKYNQYSSDKSKFKSFRDFLKKEEIGAGLKTKDENNEEVEVWDLDIRSVTISLIKKYKFFLETELKITNETTIYNKLNVLRIIYNKAIQDEIIDGKDYPFGRGQKKIQIRPGESMKIGLDENELEAFEDILIDENNTEIISELKKDVRYIKNLPCHILDLIDARNAFLFSFCFAGMRCEDTLNARWSDFKNGRYYYFMGKNSKPVTVPIPDRVLPILEYYEKSRNPENDLIFPYLNTADFADPEDVHRKLRTANKKINTCVSLLGKVVKIHKDISMHIARHTFGNISKGEIPADVLQILYRHSTITTTINYQKNWIHDKVDEGLLKIVNLKRKKDETIVAA